MLQQYWDEYAVKILPLAHMDEQKYAVAAVAAISFARSFSSLTRSLKRTNKDTHIYFETTCPLLSRNTLQHYNYLSTLNSIP